MFNFIKIDVMLSVLQLEKFLGNKDPDTIQPHKVFPVLATRVILMKAEYHNNFALRMELFGCKPGATLGFPPSDRFR